MYVSLAVCHRKGGFASMIWCETWWGLHHALRACGAGDAGARSWGHLSTASSHHRTPRAVRDGKGAAVTYRSVGSPEAVDLLLGAVERALGSERLEDLDNVIPELLVVLVEQDNDASGLRVEGRGDVEKGLLGELLDLRVRDGRLLVELVVCAALLDGLEDVLGKLG